METASKAEFARRLGVSKPRVSQLVSQGLPVLDDGRIDLAAGLAWVAQHVDRAQVTQRGGSPAVAPGPALVPPASRPVPLVSRSDSGVFEPDAGSILLKAKAKRAVVNLRRAERLEKVAAGELAPVIEMRSEFESRVRNARSKLLAFGHRLSPRLAIESDVARCNEIIEAAVAEVMADLAEPGGQE